MNSDYCRKCGVSWDTDYQSHECPSSASSACSGEDARQADKASAVTQRSGDEVMIEEALSALRCFENQRIRSADRTFKIGGLLVRIEITRQE
jgi:hypothetical protein